MERPDKSHVSCADLNALIFLPGTEYEADFAVLAAISPTGTPFLLKHKTRPSRRFKSCGQIGREEGLNWRVCLMNLGWVCLLDLSMDDLWDMAQDWRAVTGLQEWKDDRSRTLSYIDSSETDSLLIDSRMYLK